MTTPLGWLLPGTTPVLDGVRVADVGVVAWQVLLRDGALLRVWGDLAAPAGRPVGPEVRAGALRPLVPPRAVIGRAGAVWVHTGGPAPGRVDVLVARRARRPAPHPQRVPHECPLPPHDVVRLGEVGVTTVVRTALDLARWVPAPQARPLLRRLARRAGLDLATALTALDRSGVREGSARARATLEASLAPSADPSADPSAGPSAEPSAGPGGLAIREPREGASPRDGPARGQR